MLYKGHSDRGYLCRDLSGIISLYAGVGRASVAIVDPREELTQHGEKLLPAWELFQGVSPDTLDRLERCGRVRALTKGDVIIQARQPQEDVYIQMDGKSMVYNLTHTGDRKILFILGPGALLNEHVLNLNDASAYCEAIEPGTAFTVPVSEFLRLMENDFALACRVLAAQERKIWRLGHQLKNSVSISWTRRRCPIFIGRALTDGLDTICKNSVTNVMEFFCSLCFDMRRGRPCLCEKHLKEGAVMGYRATRAEADRLFSR